MPQTSNEPRRPASRVLAALGREAWAITPGMLEALADIAQRNVDAADAVLRRSGEELRGASWLTEVREGVAVIPVHGVIMRYAGLFVDACGATSVERVARDLAAAVDNPAVRAVVLDVDSPGGQVTGINELAGQIAAARAVKPVVAYVGGMGASAAYWLACAAGEVVAERTAELGSIGVVAAYVDDSERDKMEGIRRVEIVSSQSPKKRLDPGTKAGRAEVQTLVDGLADVFVATVAANRGTTAEDVLENFGQGGVLLAEAAVAAGMADRLGSLESVISELAARGSGLARPQAQEAKMPADTKQIEGQLTADAVTADWLAANKPGLVESILAEASAQAIVAERARVSGILALGIVGHADLVRAAIDNGQTSGDLAVAVLQAEANTRQALGQKTLADAAAATVDDTPSPDADGQNIDGVIAAAAAAMNKGRK